MPAIFQHHRFKSLLRVAACTCCLLAANLKAGQWWLEPQQYQFSYGDEIIIFLKQHPAVSSNCSWQKLMLQYDGVTDDLSNQSSGMPNDSIQFRFYDEGSVVVTATSCNQVSTVTTAWLDSILFSQHPATGLSTANVNSDLSSDSSIHIQMQQFAKTLLQVGANKTDIVRQPSGLALELLPLDHPYQLRGNTLRWKLLLHGVPLPQTRLYARQQLAGHTRDTLLTTDASGIAVIDPGTAAGTWQISALHRVKPPQNTSTPTPDWQLYLSTATWGYTGKTTTVNRAR